MTIKQAIKILESHNKWRRGGKGKMTDPTQLGIAIDLIVSEIKDRMQKRSGRNNNETDQLL